MIDSGKNIEAFTRDTLALHLPGIHAHGKAYKQHSHKVLASIFDELANRLNIAIAIEIGAFQAEFSRRFLTTATNRKALAVEANPYNYNAFKEGLAAAGVIYHHAAVQDKTGTTTLQLMDTAQDIENGFIRGNNSILSSSERTETKPLTVPATTLDELVTEYVSAGKIPDPSTSPPLLWIDVEGALNLVIAGGSKTIRNSVALFTEVEATALWDQQCLFPEICGLLDELGFTPFLRDCEYEPEQFNVIFVNRERIGESILNQLSVDYTDKLKAFTG